MELAERMRQQNHEQFQTLVRMHLSFELDLHTDDNDVAPIGDGKGAKFRKRFQFNKKPKVAPPVKAGSPVLSKECIGQMRKLMEFLMKEQNVIQEGIFRRTGSVARQNELKTRVVNDSATAPPLSLDNGTYTVHDCASVLKGVLADLPEPLLTETYAPAHLQMAELCNSLESTSSTSAASAAAATSSAHTTEASPTKATRLLHSLQLLILLLPTENRQLLQEIIEMLNVTIRHECSNKMSADSLATLFTPHLICPKKLTPEALHSTAANLSGIISFMITRGAAIFECPPKLATDIRAYFAEQRRKQTLSPEQILDESVTSDSTANTVYTFVDRERTAQAHDQNPTDTCLAQLYAYIQSLPESSKKRKLIKQFNKENGQGTPLQVQKLHRLKNGGGGGEGGSATKTGQGKSLSDSIKRHIFQKHLLARTPKIINSGGQQFATPGPLVRAYDTPTNRSTSQTLTPQPLKSRVLFQSPATTPCRPVRPVPPVASTSSAGATVVPKTTITISTLAVVPQPSTKELSPQTKVRSSNVSTATDDSCDALESSEFELLSETITQLQTAASYTSAVDGPHMGAKKSVAFCHASDVVQAADDIPEIHDDCENNLSATLRSRHRSEPNLSNILGEHNVKLKLPAVKVEPASAATTSKSLRRQTGGRFISNKLLKGVSMVNLMVPSQNGSVHTPHMRKSTTSSQLVRSAERHPSVCHDGSSRPNASHESDADEEEDIDDPDFVATPQSQRSRSSTFSRRFSADGDFADIVTPTTRAGGGHASLLMQQQHVLNLGRRSMSPITKSTQRMSKAMQESIMTPRSRKPVMLPGALLGLADTVNHGGVGAQNSFCSFREQDEDEHFGLDTLSDERGCDRSLGAMYKSKSEGDFGILMQANGEVFGETVSSVTPSSVRLSLGSASLAPAAHDDDLEPESLTSPFKNYLFSRSVVSASPVDSSFSSQPDDFGSASDIHTLATVETDLSDSLLYCLDGNQPQQTSSEGHCASTSSAASSSASSLSRKRTNGGAEDGADAAEQRQYFDDLHPKKVTLVVDGDADEPGETSL